MSKSSKYIAVVCTDASTLKSPIKDLVNDAGLIFEIFRRNYY